MKHIAAVLLLLLTYFLSSAQAPLVKQWDRRFGGNNGDIITCFSKTSDRGYIICGHSKSGISGDKTQANWDSTLAKEDFWMVKIDSLGIKQWDKTFGGTDDDRPQALQQTNDGGYILGGSSGSGISGDKTEPSRGGADYWIVKTDAFGNKLWDKRYGGAFTDALFAIQQTIDGGYILGGYTSSDSSGDKTQSSRGGFDMWIVKTDVSGNKQWDKRFGGTGLDELFALQQTTDGGYFLAGLSDSPMGGDKTQASRGNIDYWVVKTDSSGTKEWDYRFGGTGDDECYSALQTSDGGFVLAGYSDSGINGDKSQPSWGLTDYWVVKLDPSGIKQWDKRFGGIGDEDELGNVLQTTDGGYLVTGTSYSNISGDKSEDNSLGIEQVWVVKTDTAGVKQWDKTIYNTAHDEIGYALETEDVCYTIANWTVADTGGYKTQFSRGLADYWIIKFRDTTTHQPATCNLSVDITAPQTVFCNGDSVRLTAEAQGAGSAAVLDQQQTVYNGGTSARTLAGYSEWQSFTAGITGTMTQLDIGFFTLINGVGRLSIYAGNGTGGTLLWRQNVNVVCGGGNCTLPFAVSTPVVAGQVYTFEFVPGAGMPDPYGIQIANPGPYAGGEMNIVDPSGTYPTGFDMVFKTYVGGSSVTYAWSTGVTDSAIDVNTSGEYFVTVSDNNGCTAVDSITVSRDSFSVSINVNGDTLSVSNTVTQQWYLNGNAISGANSSIYIATQSGSYTVEGTDAYGCEAVSAPVVINLTAPLRDSVSSVFNTCFSQCNGSATVVAMDGMPPYHYLWQPRGDTTASVSGLCGGEYKVTITDNNGNVVVDSVFLPIVDPVEFNLTASVTEMCSGDTAIICAPAIYHSYIWSTNDTSQCIRVTQAGNYYATATDPNNCPIPSVHLPITVYPLPPVSISVNGDTLKVNNAVSQQWYLNGSAITGATTTMYIATQAGSYTVMVTDSNGCTATSSPVIITGLPMPSLGGMASVDEVSVYPNPLSVGSCWLLVGNNFIGGTVEVTDADGKTVFKSEIRNSKSEISFEAAKGVYLLRMTSGSSSTARKLVRL